MTTQNQIPVTNRSRWAAILALLVLIPLLVTQSNLTGARGATPSGGPPLTYVVNGTDLFAINANTNQFLATVASLPGPATSVAITPDARYALVGIGPTPPSAAGQVAVVDAKTHTVVAGVSAPTVGTPFSMAIAPNGRSAYVLGRTSSPTTR